MRKIRQSVCAWPLLLAWGAPAAMAADLASGDFSVDQLFDPANGTYSGAANFLYNNSSGLTGYINVVDSSNNWQVQNLPVGFLGSDASAYSDLAYEMAVASASSTSPVTFDSLYVDFTPGPETTVTSIEADSTLQSRGVTTENYGIGDTTAGSDPSGDIVLGSPALGTLVFNAGNNLNVAYQPGHPNIDAAWNQCAPAAVANSLAWLAKTNSLSLPNPNIPGMRVTGGPPPSPANTLVGTLESGPYMNRAVTNWNTGSGVWPLDGKLKYLGATGLGWLDVSYQNSDGGQAGNGLGFTPGQNYTAGGVTAKNRGAPSFSFILSELQKGEDVELDFSGPISAIMST